MIVPYASSTNFSIVATELFSGNKDVESGNFGSRVIARAAGKRVIKNLRESSWRIATVGWQRGSVIAGLCNGKRGT